MDDLSAIVAAEGDWTPETTRHPGQIYRTKDYARAETERLARQLAEMKEPA